jgi:hypothetical protein
MASAPAVVPLQVAPCLADVSLSFNIGANNTAGNAIGTTMSGQGQSNLPVVSFQTGGNITYTDDGAAASAAQLAAAITTSVGIIWPYNLIGRLLASGGKQIDAQGINTTVLRLEAWLRWATNPLGAGQASQDSGLIFVCGNPASESLYDTTQANQHGNLAGFGVTLDQATGKYKFIAAINSAAGSPMFQQQLAAPAGGLTAAHHFDFLFSVGTNTTPASIQFSLDGVVLIAQAWGPGTNLPTYLGSGFGQTVSFQPILRNNSGAVANANMILYGMRCRIGSLAAVTLENND